MSSTTLDPVISNPSVPTPAERAPEKRSRRVSIRLIVISIGLALLAGPMAMAGPPAGIVAIGAVFIYAIVKRPPLGAISLIVLTPLVVGIDRGGLIPMLRVNEALIGAVLIALGIRWFLDPTSLRLRWIRIDSVVMLLAFLSFVPMMLLLIIKNGTVTFDEVVFGLVMTKHFAVYLVFRLTIVDAARIHSCLWATTLTAAFVAVIGVLQSTGLGGFDALLAQAYGFVGTTVDVSTGRGQSTIGNSVAMAFYVPAHLAITMAMIAKKQGPRPVLFGLAGLFTVGTLGTGQFSGLFALIIVAIGYGLLTRTIISSFRWVIPGSPLLVAALWPVIAQRLEGFQQPGGVPQSWTVRWENLRDFVLPELADYSWVLGVSPIAEIPAPHMALRFIWIESGHLYLLWVGGVPLFLAYFVYNIAGLRMTKRRLALPGPYGAAALASHLVLWMLIILMLFDAHISMRGSADIQFPLLALALVAAPGVTMATRGPTAANTNAATPAVQPPRIEPQERPT